MANLAAALRAEVSRLARKEVRAETEALKKTVAAQRTEIAQLKRKTAELEKALKGLARSAERSVGPASAPPTDAGPGKFRFRAAGMASNRKRLGLAAGDFGLLVGATGQSVYAWEAGKSKPRAEGLAAIAALRGIGKREAQKRLAELKRP